MENVVSEGWGNNKMIGAYSLISVITREGSVKNGLRLQTYMAFFCCELSHRLTLHWLYAE